MADHVLQIDEEQALERFRGALRGAGVKVTHQRTEIFRELLATSEHPDAETVFRGVRTRVPQVSLDTVYRTLWLLIDLGLISTLGPPRERMRFDANTLPHHHFICLRCGQARDFLSPEFDELAVPPDAREFGQVQRTHVELRGICRACSAPNGNGHHPQRLLAGEQRKPSAPG